MHHNRISGWAVRLVLMLLVGSVLVACANIGTIEGGPYDMTPPRLVEAVPASRATEVTRGRIRLTFDEYVKIGQQDKVIVSPPQMTPPVITASGKSIQIRLEDALRPNTTYSVYFDDAIVDNNEDNPLRDFSYTFSTGATIDTMQISGVVLDALTLEPVGGLVIGAYPEADFVDSTAVKEAMPYASKTSKLGKFTVRGLPDSVYRVLAIQDVDNNYRYTASGNEGIAFDPLGHRTTKLDSIRTDTIRIDSIVRRDTIRRDSLVTRDYTYYKPDNIVLRYFVPQQTRLGIDRATRIDSLVCRVEFLTALDAIPQMRSLDKPGVPIDSIYYASAEGKAVSYWLRDMDLVGQDSIRFEIDYDRTDSLMQIQRVTDTLTFHKPRERASSRKKEADSLALKLTFSGASSALAETLRDSLLMNSSLPLREIPEGAIRLETSADSVYTPMEYRLERVEGAGLRYALLFERAYGNKYRVRVDSAAMYSIYGHPSDSIVYEQRTQPEAELGKLEVRLHGMDSDRMIAELLDKSGNVLLSTHAIRVDSTAKPTQTSPEGDPMLAQILSGETEAKTDSVSTPALKGTEYMVSFADLKPSDYYLRLYVDTNEDGQWTTGEYPTRQPEAVYYSPALYAVKKGFTTAEVWLPTALPLDQQKPEALRKVKPDPVKEQVDKNIEYYKKHPRK